MRILVTSRRKRLYSTRRLVEEGRNLGHEVEVLDPLKCVLQITTGTPKLLYGMREVRDVDVVVPRISTFATAYSIAVIRHLDWLGIPCVNDHGPIARARNKLGCLQLLASRGIRVPDTLISRYPKNIDLLLDRVGGTPAILKLLRGTQGTGVIFAESQASVESVLETIWSLGEDIMVQRFVAESKGRDIRAMVIDGEVRSCMRRIGREGEFRSNIHRGGVGEKLKLPREYARVASRAVEAVGLRLAGVDILESSEGPLVIEVNSSPGFQGLEAATGDNVARMIMEFAAKLGRKARRR
ncbi:MAG: RimK family alpha-L-glutamate ligase [Planctomycetes bacterium]|nr:RimK family alpha-L-glutamate ligase [Planctomycetota bacterium]